MKVTIDFDLSPAEARELFGLPDFSGVHQTLTADMLKQCQEDPQAAFDLFIKPAMEQGMNSFSAYQNMITSFMQTTNQSTKQSSKK